MPAGGAKLRSESVTNFKSGSKPYHQRIKKGRTVASELRVLPAIQQSPSQSQARMYASAAASPEALLVAAADSALINVQSGSTLSRSTKQD